VLPETDKPRLALSLYRRALAFVRLYPGQLAAVFGVSLLSTLASLAQPYLSKWLIDEALLRRDARALFVSAVAMVLLTVLGFLTSIAASYLYTRLSAAVLFDMRVALYRHLLRQSPAFWTRHKLGDIVSRLNNDIAEVQRISSDSLLSLASNTMFLIGSVAVMAQLSGRLLMLSIVFLPFAAWLFAGFQSRLVPRVREVRERSASIGSFLIETLMGSRLVTSSRAVDRETERFRAENGRFLRALLRMQMTGYAGSAAPGVLLALSTAAVFLYGGHLVIGGAMTVGSLVAFLAYHLRLLAPVQSFFAVYSSLLTGGVALGRVFEMFDLPPAVLDAPDAEPLKQAQGHVRFDHVSFSHDGPRAVLRDFNLEIKPGEICALIGPSGIGKSTVADLLLRFHDPDSGRVLLDERDLRSLRLDDLRAQIALVEQVPFFFNCSVADNLRYTRPTASTGELEAACRAAGIHDFVAALPQGYQTVIAERGQTLSAGERQRLAIARALIQNAAVIVMDEPSAALDEAAEARLSETIQTSLHGRTVILITHRPALRAIASQVCELQS